MTCVILLRTVVGGIVTAFVLQMRTAGLSDLSEDIELARDRDGF